jgi:RimJ/RimL family protein N-acetyltransferase
MDSDPEVVRHIDLPWTDAKSHRAFLHQRITRSYPAGLGYWSVVLKPIPAAFIGWVLLLPYDPAGPDDANGPDVEIGWRFLRSAWGNGYASEAGLAVLSHGFEAVGLDRIVADIHPDNTRSIRVAEKLGLRLVGEGKVRGKLLRSYALDREQYANAQS